MDQFENNLWSAPAKADKLRLFVLGIDGAELETLLKDLPMPEPGAKDGISVKEAVEVILICYIICYVTYYIT